MTNIFGEWLLKKGLKKYTAAIILAMVIDTALIINYDGIWNSYTGGLHIIMVSIGHLALLGFNIGLIYHIVSGYRLWRTRELNKK